MAFVKNVVLIDDDNIFNFINKKIISMTDFAEDVSSYSNAVRAIEDLWRISNTGEKSFPDVIFLDINMPVMDGWEFLDEFEKLPIAARKDCIIYMLTSSIDPSDIEKARSYKSVKNFISKPLSEEILMTLSQD